jgi:hypothetical protein
MQIIMVLKEQRRVLKAALEMQCKTYVIACYRCVMTCYCAAGDDGAQTAAARDEGSHGDGSAGVTQPPKHRQVRHVPMTRSSRT